MPSLVDTPASPIFRRATNLAVSVQISGWTRPVATCTMVADTPAYYRRHLDELELVCQMLVRVLEGTPYSVVAKESGVGHSAVEKRVKAVERRLRHLIGVTGAAREEPLSVHQMRALRQEYLNAIDALRNTQVVEKKIRRPITEEDLARAAELTHRYSNCPTRDTALLYTVFATGAKPIGDRSTKSA